MQRGLLVVAALVLVAQSVFTQSKPSIQGVWRVVETTGGRSGGTKTPQPGLVIFTAKHYAILRDTADKPRTRPKDVANPTAAEALAAYQPFMAQGGTYEVKGSDTLLVTATVAKNPPASGKYGNPATWTMKLDGNNLTITQTAGAAAGAPTTNATTLRLVRVE